MRPINALITIIAVPACVEAQPEPELGETEQAIIHGYPAYDWMVERAVKPEYPCTATLIGRHHVLTAAHCTLYNNWDEHVYFYREASAYDHDLESTITLVFRPPGVVIADDDYWNDDDKYADIAVLEIEPGAPRTAVAATLAWKYPGEGALGTFVGAGNHDGAGTNSNDIGELRFVGIRADSDDDDGSFTTDQDRGNKGDSGGPIYQNRKVFGVVHGTNYWGSGLFTSVPEHLDWILGKIGYQWLHGTPAQYVYRTGTVMQTFGEATHRMCQYACDHSPCDAYNWSWYYQTCVLLQDPTGSFSQPLYYSAAM